MAYRPFVLCMCLLGGATLLPAQWRRASLAPDGALLVEPVPAPAAAVERRGDPIAQLPGFPVAAVANATFKNLRNVTLVNIDGRPGEEILWATDKFLFAYAHDRLLWAKPLTGTAIYPPSVADVDGDGMPEIVQVTGGVPAAGRVYVTDLLGRDLPGWPISFNDHWIANAAALADVDGQPGAEIIVNELAGTSGRVHVLRADGTELNDNWPVVLDARPAVTPSVGDLDGDGAPEIVAFSSQSRFVLGLDGRPLPGWPQTTHPRQRYSFQSPILADLDGDGRPEIIGATHGDNAAPEPYFFALHPDGAFVDGWPIAVPGNNWTYSTPTVVPGPTGYRIFMGRPIGSEPKDMLYGWDGAGNLLPGFPIVKPGGLEGIISVADVDGDREYELVFPSNLIDSAGYGFIHAYLIDGSGETTGFPLRPRGFTYMNGAAIADVNGDGRLNLVALSYTQRFGQGVDSVYLNVYDLGTGQAPEKVIWGTYKGDNSRAGMAASGIVLSRPDPRRTTLPARLWPNPAGGTPAWLEALPRQPMDVRVELAAADGRRLRTLFRGKWSAGAQRVEIPAADLPPGVYWVLIRSGREAPMSLRFVRTSE